MIGLLMHKDRKIGQRTSGLLLCFWILMTVYGSLKLRTYTLTGLDKVRVVGSLLDGEDNRFFLSHMLVKFVTCNYS